MILIVLIIVVAIGLVIYLFSKNINDTPQRRLRKFQRQYLKNQYKKTSNIVSQEVPKYERINQKSSYLIGEDGTIIRNENDSQQTIKYIPISNDNSKIQVTCMSTEDAANKEAVLRKRLLSGEQLNFADCNYMLDLTDDVEVWKAICKNHIQESIYPPINIIENYNSVRSIEFYDMIYRIINLGTVVKRIKLYKELIANVI